MKRVMVILALFAVLFISLSSANTVKTEFTIAGCSLTNSIGDQIDLAPNSCSGNGFYYCPANGGDYYKTLFDPKGCSMGKDSYSAGQNRCCPAGFICDSGTLICERGGVECSQYDGSASQCENAGCFYISETDSCVSSPDEYSCGIYESSTSCAQDTYNLGKQGFGTEVCNEGEVFNVGDNSYVVPSNSCKCAWSGTSCKLQWDFVESIHAGSPSSYQCQIEFDFGSCQAGFQQISWTAVGLNGKGVFLSGISQEALEAPGCIDAQMDVTCGEPIIKVPGFSLLATVLVILILGMFYFLRRH